VHATGVEFNHAFFVGDSAEAYAIVVGIVFRTFDDTKGGVERVAAGFQEGECVLEIVEPVIGADDDGALVRTGLCIVLLRGWLRLFTLGARSYSCGNCS
jgi:hypothetical protein